MDVSRLRMAMIIALLLVGGALVNVGVAWGLVATHRDSVDSRFKELRCVKYDPHCGIFAQVTDRFGYARAVVGYWMRTHGRFPKQEPDPPRWLPTQLPNPLLGQNVYETAGLPMRSVYLHRILLLPPSPGTEEFNARWPGFAINTLFYALLLAVPYAGLVGLRHVRRARRGRCTHCAYDLSATPPGAPCPECGRPRTACPPSADQTVAPE